MIGDRGKTYVPLRIGLATRENETVPFYFKDVD